MSYIVYVTWAVRQLTEQTKTGPVWSRRQTSKWCTGKPDPSNLYQDEGWWSTGPRRSGDVPVVDHPPPGSTRSVVTRVYSDWGPAASGGQTVLANDRNGGRLRLIASRMERVMSPYGTNGQTGNCRLLGRTTQNKLGSTQEFKPSQNDDKNSQDMFRLSSHRCWTRLWARLATAVFYHISRIAHYERQLPHSLCQPVEDTEKAMGGREGRRDHTSRKHFLDPPLFPDVW